jgi:aspartate aminotransferase
MIDRGVEELLEPLERFEALRRRAVRLGDRLCDLSYANPYGGARSSARAVIRAALDDERTLDLQYSPFGGQTLARRAVADDLRLSHELPFAFDDVVLTPGAMSALQIALITAGAEGDEVVVPVPSWLDHPLYVRALGMVFVPLPLDPPRFDLDVDALLDALTPSTCAVLLSQPANPTGRLYSAERLAELGRALRAAEERLGRGITLISDETHRDFTADGAYASAATAFDRTLIVYSFGKYHFMQGQRLGYAAVSPRHPEREAVGRELVRWTRIRGIATPTALMQRALPALLALRHDQEWLTRWRGRLVAELSEAGYRVEAPDATLFLYLETPGGQDDFRFAERLAAAGVLVLPAPLFHHAGWWRLSLTGSEDMLERAVPVLARFACP